MASLRAQKKQSSAIARKTSSSLAQMSMGGAGTGVKHTDQPLSPLRAASLPHAVKGEGIRVSDLSPCDTKNT